MDKGAYVNLDMLFCCLVIKSCPTLCDPMGQSTLDPPVLHCLPEFGQIHVGSFNDTVQLIVQSVVNGQSVKNHLCLCSHVQFSTRGCWPTTS